MSVRVAILGQNGRMGTQVAKIAEEDFKDRVEVVGGASIGDSLDPLFDADVIIDFSGPDALVSLKDAAASREKLPSLVSGTTGMKPAEKQKLSPYWDKAPVLIAANFSVGVLALHEILKNASPLLDKLGYVPVLVEAHHKHKKDAPSGTALSLQRVISPAGPGNVQTHSIRAGEVFGEHHVTFYGRAEEIVIGHKAQDRSIWARGAIEVALWLNDRRQKDPDLKGRISIDDYLK